MIRRKSVAFLVAAMVTAVSLTGCQEINDNENRNEEQSDISENAETESDETATPYAEDAEEPDFSSKENAGEAASLPEEKTGPDSEMTPKEMHDQFFAQFYKDLSYEEIEQIIMERNEYYHNSSYYGDIVDYWENERGIYDISGLIEPLYFSDMKYYTEEDFKNVPSTVIHLAKNEIYARHGYIFENKDISNYFMSCAWYQPVYSKADFDDSVFNDYEKQNLELLSSLDQ